MSNSVAENTKIDETTDKILYMGFASAESLTSASAWSIKRLLTDGSVEWAEGSSANRYVWDNRLSYNYGSL